MKKNKEKKCQSLLTHPKLNELLEKVDWEFAQEALLGGCLHCGAKLHWGCYERKPRGGPWKWDKRYSFCCSQEGCRRRRTPPSVRFLGRKVYTGAVLVLVSAMTDSITEWTVRRLRELLGISRRTLKRWQDWWQHGVLQSAFWKGARSRFLPPVEEKKSFVGSLWQRFGADSPEGLVRLLRFLSPLSIP